MGAPRRRVASPSSRLCRLTFLMPPALPGEQSPGVDKEPRSNSLSARALIEKINPILRGWVNYFSLGHSSRCLSFIRNWVEQKIRRHLARAQLRRGFGWKRWSRRWMYEALGLFDDYSVRYLVSSPKVAPAERSHNS